MNFFKKLKNKGSSYIMVVVGVSFVAILATTVLSLAVYNANLKRMNRNVKDSFYYVDKALNEVQAGIGNDSLACLTSAYNDTLAALVYYDPTKEAYVTMSDDAANEYLANKYIYYLNDLGKYNDIVSAEKFLQSYVAADYLDEIGDNKGTLVPTHQVKISVTAINSDANGIVIQGVVASKDDEQGINQTVKTDINLLKPVFQVNFNQTNFNSSEIFEYIMVADRGVDLRNGKFNLVGSVYGASDFSPVTYKNFNSMPNATTGNATTYSSKYSGLYMNSATVDIQAKRLVVPGTIGVDNGSSFHVTGAPDAASNLISPSEIWCDNIALVGFNVSKGPEINMNAVCNIRDDLQVDAEKSVVSLWGEYYGYSYSTSGENSVDTSGNVVKAHSNSSAIVINGANASLDLSNLNKLVVAGRAYIDIANNIHFDADSIYNGASITEESDISEHYTSGGVDVDDYVTGESISIKSNQLAYKIPETWIIKKGTDISVNIPSDVLAAMPAEVLSSIRDASGRIKVVECPVPGSTEPIYFYDFDSVDASETYIVWYENLLTAHPELADITSGNIFAVNRVRVPDTAAVYTSGAISVKRNLTSSISIETAGDSTVASADGTSFSISDVAIASQKLSNHYRLAKYYLGVPSDADLPTPSIDYSVINTDGVTSPLNEYVTLGNLVALSSQMTVYDSDNDAYKWISNDDITLSKMGNVADLRGVVISAGDVTIDSSVNSFTGLIIACGKITINRNGALSFSMKADGELVKSMIGTDNNRYDDAHKNERLSYFLNVKYDTTDSLTGTGVSLESVQYDSLVTFSNWQRNEE